MKTVVGILKSRSEGEAAVADLLAAGIGRNRITLLTPETGESEIERVRTTETEQPGMGKTMGGVVGGALGAASGMTLGVTAANLLVPGVGAVLALGLAGAAILAAGGAIGGAVAGEALEEAMAQGLPVDELFFYEHALREGRTVVMAFAKDWDEAEKVRAVMMRAGTESIDAARERWWVGLRDAEKIDYLRSYDDFETAEFTYRRGFEASLHPATRGRSYEEALDELKKICPGAYESKVFRQGYERGAAYFRKEWADRKSANAQGKR
jgi:hypothetical protein